MDDLKKALDTFISLICPNCGHNLRQNGGVLKSIYKCQNCKDTFMYAQDKKLLCFKRLKK